MKNRTVIILTLLATASLLINIPSINAQQTYFNDFASESFPEVFGDWTLDTDNRVLNYFREGGIFAGTAAVQVTGWTAADFVVSSRFTLNRNEGTGNPILSGFGVLSESSTLTSGDGDYYLADWEIGGGGNARLRLYAFESGSANLLGTATVGKGVEGATYELRLTCVYDGGNLNLTFALFDEDGSEIGSLTRTHENPIAGEWFGLRNRTHSGTDHVLDLNYHEFTVRTPPELRIGDLHPAPGALFHRAGDGLHFTVSTGADSAIDPEDIELFLDGDRVPPGELTIAGESPSFDVSFAGLEPDRIYVAEVVARDNVDTVTQTWTFDTWDDEGAVFIEAEDYNFAAGIDCGFTGDPSEPPVTGGSCINDPVPSTFDGQTQMVINRDDPQGNPIGYVDRVGVPGVDFYNTSTETGDVEHNQYRFCDPVGTEESGDFLRRKYVEAADASPVEEIPDFHVHRVQTGEWLNYTRDFPEGTYRVLLRASSSGSPVMRLDRVTGDPSAGDQETEILGHFITSPSGGEFTYAPLTDSSGVQPVLLSLSGEDTLRLTAESGANNNINLNFFVLMPVDFVPPSVASVSPPAHSGNVSPASAIEAELTAGSSPLDVASVRLFINDAEVPANVVQTAGGATVSYTPDNLPPLDNTVRVEFDDLGGSGPYSFAWSFSVQLEGTQEIYFNDFSTDGFPEMQGPWTLNAGSQVLNYYREGGIFSGAASTEIPDWNTTGFVVSTRVTVNAADGSGNPITFGFGVLSGSSALDSGTAPYYLADWGIGGGNSGNLRILRLPANNTVFSSSAVNIGPGAAAQTYELRLTGIYDGGVLKMTLAVYDESGEQIGGTATATDTQPLTGEWFGVRNRTHSSTGHVLDLDYHYFSVATVPPSAVPPVPRIARDGTQIVLTWDDPDAQLETAPHLSGPWSIVEGATSPHSVDPVNPRQFFRLRLE